LRYRNRLLKLQALSQSVASALATLKHHPRRVAAGLAVLLLGTGVTAFGVAPLAPDAAQLPVTEVVEQVQALPLAPQADTLLAHRFNLYRTEQTRSTDTADSLLSRLNINDPTAAAFLRKDAAARSHIFGRGTRTISAEANDDQQLVKLTLRWSTDDLNFFKRLVVERRGEGFISRIETDRYNRSSRLVSGPINKTLRSSFDSAKLDRELTEQIAGIFSGDLDFSRSARQGDRYSVYYEVLEADGEPLRTGRILAAEIILAGRAQHAIWFVNEAAAKGENRGGAYYNLDGKSLAKGYMTPLESSVVTSSFSMRMNPVLSRMTAHKGIDYAAPTGTPVRAVADGTVEFAGRQNGYGNVIFLNHGKGHTTVYAHLNNMAVSQGQKVTQGQYLGGVGRTGWATGPHLHFEFRVNGVHQDPTQMARAGTSSGLSAAVMPSFKQSASQMRQQLNAGASVQQPLIQ
jgi:murein DD-endopeptidase MepM/ murein hydrolase activator NlpD